ncbi:hypothetical protein RHM58_31310 [Pseudomonas sp. 10S4]|uniref:hypothetical protein n=1 Tax=Pseudomonas sp. 10S4 TaxID=3048583 RepID=UPI002AC9E5A0|nr:hypothetical protein [Pseudomonas sp. 10S4]WPX18184.1 hypothetical protein RHM58_31310 [Pseudomonas sp. 10S4]
MTKDQLPALAAAVSRAIEAGKAAAEAALDDGGSANLDRVYIRVGLLREGTMDKAGITGWMQAASTYHARAFHLSPLSLAKATGVMPACRPCTNP